MKVAFVGDYDEAEIVAAPIKVAKELFKQLQLLGVNVTFLTYFADGKKYNRFQKLFGKEEIDVNIKRLGIFPLIREIMKMKPEIVQLTNAASFYLVLILLKPFVRTKFCYINHSIISYTLRHVNTYNHLQTIRFLIIQFIVLKNSDIILVYSKRDARYLSRYLKTSSKKLKIIFNGVNDLCIYKEFSKRESPLKVITVGSINRKEKNINLLLSALSRLNYDVELTVCSNELDQKINIKMPPNIKVHFLYSMNEEELRKRFVANDIYVMASYIDTFPLSLFEAMNSGIPFVISSRIGTIEQLEDEMKNTVFHYKSEEQFIKKMNHLCKLELDELSAISKMEIEFSKRFSWCNSAQQLMNSYKELMNN